MEEGKVILSTEEYRQLIEKASFNEMVYRELLNHRGGMQGFHDRMYQFENRMCNMENKLNK